MVETINVSEGAPIMPIPALTARHLRLHCHSFYTRHTGICPDNSGATSQIRLRRKCRNLLAPWISTEADVLGYRNFRRQHIAVGCLLTRRIDNVLPFVKVVRPDPKFHIPGSLSAIVDSLSCQNLFRRVAKSLVRYQEIIKTAKPVDDVQQ